MNNYVFNQYPQPLYITDMNSIKSLSYNGEIFSVVTGEYELGVDKTLFITINNPDTSTKTLNLLQVTLTSTQATLGVKLSLYKNGSFTGTATTLTPYNTNALSSVSSKANVTEGGSGAKDTDYLLFTDSINLPQYTNCFNSSICIPPKSSLLFEINQILAVLKTIIVCIFWSEK